MTAAMLLLCAGLVSRRFVLTALPTAIAAPHVARAAVLPRPAAATVVAASAAVGPSAAVEFWSGLLAGAVQKTVKEVLLHPLDTAKARMQLPGQRRSLFAELVRTPYAGIGPALVSGAPAASAFFAVKDALRAQCAAAGLNDKTASTLIAVAGANFAYWYARAHSCAGVGCTRLWG